MKKNLLLLLLLITYVGYSQSIIIGTGTTTTNGTTADPVERYYNYTHSQIVWTAAELTTAGLPSGASISGMGFSISESAVSLSNFTISMGHTGQTLANPMVASGLTVVKNAFTYAPIVQAAGSFDMITFDNPFAWDGTSNIVIDICTGSNPYISPYGGLRTSTATSGAMRIYRLDSSSNCGNYTSGTNYSVRPNVQFNYTSSGCSGTPTPGNTLASANPVCPSATSTLTLQNATTGSGVTYQWFSSADGVTYNPIGGATGSSYVASQAVQTYYYCDVTCSGNTGSSAPILVTMNNFINCYCTAVPTSIDGNGITNVVFGSLSNPNVSTTTYQDFTSLSAPDLQQGSLNNISITLGTGYDYNVRVFIDFNQDGDFDDVNENNLVGLSASTNPTTISSSISVPLSALLGNTRMRIVATDDNSSNNPCWSSSYANVEDYTVNVIPAPSCLPPSALASDAITASSATLSWTASPSTPSENYDVYWSTTNTAPDGTTTPSATNQTAPYIVTDLSSSTTYYYWVRSNCSGGDTSVWSSGGSFTTLCSTIDSFPWTEDFESITTPALPNCWSQNNVNADTDFWQTFATYGVSGSKAAGLYTDFNSGNNNDYLVLPQMTLTGNQRLRYFVRARSTSEPNDYRIVLSTATNAPADFTTELVPLTQVSSTTMTEYIVDLSAYSGDVYLAVHVPSGGLDGYYIYFDNFTVEEIPSCLSPSALASDAITVSSATLSWTDSSSTPSENYDVYWSTTNTAPDETTTPSATNQTAPYIVTDLSSSTTYYYWVRANCGGGDTSVWSSGGSFTTLCDLVSSFAEDFETTTGSSFPNCWSKVGSTGSANTQASTGISGSRNLYMYSSSTSNLAVVKMPEVNNADAGTHRFKMKVRANLTIGGIVEFGYLTDPSDASTFVTLGSITTNSSSVAQDYVFNAVTTPTGVTTLALRTLGSPANSCLIDDIVYEAMPTDAPDYVSLQWPPNATITRGSNFDVYGQVYENGLTDVEPGLTNQASGIQAWIGISPEGQNTNPSTWTNWIPATWNSGFVDNNDEYSATIGSSLLAGTYYYVTRFSLNEGPYRYGGIDSSNNGNFWDGVTYMSGVLTVTALPGDNCSAAIDLNTLSSPYNGTTVGGSDESNPSCGTNSAPDMHYKIDVPYGYRLNIQQTTNNYDSKNYVFYGDCVTQTSIACFDDPDNTAVSWLNTTGSTQTVYWINDGYANDSGTFTLEWSLVEEPCYFTTTWDGSNWSNGVPVANTKAIINGNYTGAGFTACALDILGTSVVTFPAGEVLNIDGLINIAATATFELSNDAYVLQNQNVTNLGTSIVNRDSSPMIRLDYTAWSSPVNGQNLLAFSPNTIANRFYTYDYAGNSWSSVDPSSTSFAPGLGYLIRVANTWSTSVYSPYNGLFSGVLNNGTYNIASGLGYNLLGNPYPSPIDADAFIADNSSLLTTGALYFWTHAIAQNGSYVAQSNYASYTTAGGVAATAGGAQPDGIIQLGQGFLTDVNSATNIQFNNAQRLGASNGQFYKATTIEKHRLWLSLSDNANNYNQMMIAYMTGATNGVDFAIDAKLFTNSPSSLSSIIANENYVIQGRTLTFDPNDEVPLSFIADIDGSYTINLDNFDGLFGSQDIYLWDKTLNVVHDLKASSYSFTTLAGTYNTRFSVIYASALSNNDVVLDSSTIVVFDNGQNIEINANELTIKNVTIFDVRGRILYNKNEIQSSSHLVTNFDRNKQVLVIKIETNEGKFITKKFIF